MNNSSTVAMISLGCPKNLVNSEEMLALLQDAGYAFTDDLAKADAAIINTCAFIESAKTEAIEKILETASYREENPELKIIVSGCLAQRYADDIRAELPEVDGIMGSPGISRRAAARSARRSTIRPAPYPPGRTGRISALPRAATTAAPTALSRRCAASSAAARRRAFWKRPVFSPPPA